VDGADRRLERLLVDRNSFSRLFRQHAVTDCDEQQSRNQALDHNANVGFIAPPSSCRLVGFSNMA